MFVGETLSPSKGFSILQGDIARNATFINSAAHSLGGSLKVGGVPLRGSP